MTHSPRPASVGLPRNVDEPLLRIQEVAAETGLTPRSIRYYEELGLLTPCARSAGDYRLYDASDLERLRFIHGVRHDAGFALAWGAFPVLTAAFAPGASPLPSLLVSAAAALISLPQRRLAARTWRIWPGWHWRCMNAAAGTTPIPIPATGSMTAEYGWM